VAAAVATPLRDEIKSLGRELKRLKDEQQLLRMTQREPVEVDEPRIAPEPATPRRIIPAEYATELQQRMDSDAIDQKAVEAQQGIVTAFRGEALLRSELIDVECRETLCRVEYEHEDAEAHQQFREGMRWDAAFQNVMLFMMPTDELRLRYVMFVAREGEVLPSPASD
jgi:MoaA/NifB/PqqE/SkfB family radical SAM enzyme